MTRDVIFHNYLLHSIIFMYIKVRCCSTLYTGVSEDFYPFGVSILHSQLFPYKQLLVRGSVIRELF